MGELLQNLFSQEDIQKILKNKLGTDNFTVISYKTDPLGDWIGLCGDHALLHVCVKLSREENTWEKSLSFFVKLYPRAEYVVIFIEGTGSFRKEIFVYQLFEKFLEEEIKVLTQCVPECYLTKTNKFLAMENLMEQGYVSLNKHEFFNYDTVKLVLEALSKFHASSLIYEEKMSEKLKKPYRLIEEYEPELEETYFNDRENFPNRQGLEASFTGILNSIDLFDLPKKLLSGKDFRTVLEKVCRRVFDLVKPSKKFRNVVCHGDLWGTNILVKFDEDKKPVGCKLVDFQCGRYSPPAQDVMSVLHLTTSREFRYKNMYNLLGIYYTNLEKHVVLAGYDMKKILSFSDFLASCEEFKLFAVVQTAVYFPLILLKSELVESYFSNPDVNKKALEEDRSLLVKENIDKDDNYRNRILESMLDLKDSCDIYYHD